MVETAFVGEESTPEGQSTGQSADQPVGVGLGSSAPEGAWTVPALDDGDVEPEVSFRLLDTVRAFAQAQLEASSRGQKPPAANTPFFTSPWRVRRSRH